MKKYFSLLLPLFLAGCPMGDRINMRIAQSTVVNNQLCVSVDKPDAKEKILAVSVWDYSTTQYVYEKSYATAPQLLEPGKCISGLEAFAFKEGNKYNVSVGTGLRSYEARFSVSKQGKTLVVNELKN